LRRLVTRQMIWQEKLQSYLEINNNLRNPTTTYNIPLLEKGKMD